MTFDITDIQSVLVSTGELSKDDILSMWNLSEEQYAAVKNSLNRQSIFEPGPRGRGGFVVRYKKRPKGAPSEDTSNLLLHTEWENLTVSRLVELFTHADLEKMIGDLLYTVRRARQKLTGEDRRGTKTDLAAALVIQHGIDLFATGEIRRLVAKKLKIKAPSRWYPGKGTAREFVRMAEFPEELCGIPAPETPAEFEYLEGRLELAPLQDFQIEVNKQMLREINKPKGRAIVTLPTGGGKTRVAVDTIRDWLTLRWTEEEQNNYTVVWLAHTEELCEQAYTCFKQVWEASSQVCPLLLFRFWGRYTRDFEKHQENLLAMRERPSCLVSTPQRMLKLLNSDHLVEQKITNQILETACLLVIDEAHRAAAPSYRAVLDSLQKAGSDAGVIGLTATPFRAEYSPSDEESGTRELKSIFKKIIEPVKTLGFNPRETLQSRRFLASPLQDVIETETLLKPPPLENPEHLSEDDIEKIDYAFKKRADNPARRLLILDKLLEICADSNSKVIYFGPSVLDAECMAFLLRMRGITSAFVAGATRETTRRKIVEDFKHRDVQVLCNCEVLTTGFDAPKVTHLIMARPTVSQVLYEQMVGRGLRGEKFGGTRTCVIVDCDDRYREKKPRLGYQAFREVWKPERVPKKVAPLLSSGKRNISSRN